MPASDLKRDLLAAAEKSAAAANTEGVEANRGHAIANAKTALEASNLVEGAFSAGEIAEALGALNDELLDSGAMQSYLDSDGPLDFLRKMLLGVKQLRGELRTLDAVRLGYNELHEFCEGLEMTFGGAGTETATRLEARIHSALEDADQRVQRAQQAVAAEKAT